jgi:hypothetical protein
MSYLHLFGPNDILINRMVAKPSYELIMYEGETYLNKERDLGRNIPTGSVSLFEYNVDRDGVNQQLIKPFIIKDGYNNTINLGSNTVTGSAYNDLSVGSQIDGYYPMTSSISRNYIEPLELPVLGESVSVYEQQLDEYADARRGLISLKNTMDYYRYISDSYAYTGSYVTGAVNMLQVPSVFYSDGIEKGTVDLKFYYTGTLIGQATDHKQNGELVSTLGPTSGSTVGVVLYNEGFILLTSSAAISEYGDNLDDYVGSGDLEPPTWLQYANNVSAATASLYSLEFEGHHKIPTMTMFATAQAGEANNSLNPTWLAYSASHWTQQITSGENGYVEPSNIEIKNTVQSDYCDYEKEFEKQVFITKIGIFDEDKNLIGVAKLANPVLKKEIDSFTFKLNLDM